MSDAHHSLGDRALTDDERLSMACDWSDYRKDYGVSSDERTLKREHLLFCAGWKARHLNGGGKA